MISMISIELVALTLSSLVQPMMQPSTDCLAWRGEPGRSSWKWTSSGDTGALR